jgi:hypothetical protein
MYIHTYTTGRDNMMQKKITTDESRQFIESLCRFEHFQSKKLREKLDTLAGVFSS